MLSAWCVFHVLAVFYLCIIWDHTYEYWVRVCLLWVYVVIEHMVDSTWFQLSMSWTRQFPEHMLAPTQQIGVLKAPLCVLLVLKMLCPSTKLTFVLMLSTWCVFHVFGCVLSEFTVGSCVFTLSLRCFRAHGELKMVSNQYIVNTNESWTHASTILLGICWAIPKFLFAYSQGTKVRAQKPSHETKIGHSDCSPWAHGELTVSSRWPKWSQPAVTEPWPGPWLSCDLAVTEPWSYWRCRYWAVTEPWLSCDLVVTELWPRRDWAVTSPSHDWDVIIGPWSRNHRGHGELTVSSRWPFIFSWDAGQERDHLSYFFAIKSCSFIEVLFIWNRH